MHATTQIAQAIGASESVLEVELLTEEIGNNAGLKKLADARIKYFTDGDEGAWLMAEADFGNGPEDLAAKLVKAPAPPVKPAPTAAAPIADMEAVLAARRALRADLLAKINNCTDADVMVTMLVPELDLATREADMKVLRNDVKAAVQAKLKALGGAKPTAADMKEMFPDLVKKAARGFSLTHHGVAQRIVAETDGNLRYNIDLEQWMQWDGRRWTTLRSAQVSTLARTAANKAKMEAAMMPGTALDKLDVVDSDSFRRGVEGELAGMERVHVEQIDLNTEMHYLACGNGSVNLHTGELVSERDLLVTVRNDTEFDPTATCPTFLRVLSEAFGGNAADIEYYELAMGYTLQGRPTERAMFFHKGAGTNGKSLLLGAIRKVLGDYSASVSYKMIADAPGSTMNGGADGPSPSLRRLMHKRMAFIDEMPKGGNLRDADIKKLAGGEGGTIPTRGMRENEIEMPLTFVFHIACNSVPTIRGGEGASWKRIFPIAFNRQFENVEDITLPEKLNAEGAGILAWLVRCGEKYAKIRAEGKKLRDYMPESAEAELAHLKAEQNPFTDWIKENCDIVPDGFLYAKEGFDNYMAYEASVSLDGARNIRSVKAFVKRMNDEKIGQHKEQHGPTRKSGFMGIRLKSDAPPAADDVTMRHGYHRRPAGKAGARSSSPWRHQSNRLSNAGDADGPRKGAFCFWWQCLGVRYDCLVSNLQLLKMLVFVVLATVALLLLFAFGQLSPTKVFLGKAATRQKVMKCYGIPAAFGFVGLMVFGPQEKAPAVDAAQAAFEQDGRYKPIDFEGFRLPGRMADAKSTGFTECAADYYGYTCKRAALASLLGITAQSASLAMTGQDYFSTEYLVPEGQSGDVRQIPPEKLTYGVVKLTFVKPDFKPSCIDTYMKTHTAFDDPVECVKNPNTLSHLRKALADAGWVLNQSKMNNYYVRKGEHVEISLYDNTAEIRRISEHDVKFLLARDAERRATKQAAESNAAQVLEQMKK
jgi:P4 family phage/plasmid primase-like protien